MASCSGGGGGGKAGNSNDNNGNGLPDLMHTNDSEPGTAFIVDINDGSKLVLSKTPLSAYEARLQNSFVRIVKPSNLGLTSYTDKM